MGITQERLLALIAEYDKLLADFNAHIGAVNALLHVVGDKTDPAYASLAMMTNQYKKSDPLIEIERLWFRRFGKVNEAQRKYKQVKRAEQEKIAYEQRGEAAREIPPKRPKPKAPGDVWISVPEPDDTKSGPGLLEDYDPQAREDAQFNRYRASLSPEKAEALDRSVQEALDAMAKEE